MTIVGTRPEIIRLSRVIQKLDNFYDHFLVHTGQNYDYELNEIFFNDLGLRHPDCYLNAAGNSPSETIASIILKVDQFLIKEKPDAILVLGDTNSCLSVIAAKKRKIPIFHMEAGNRCFDQRVPEEVNRKIVDHISDVNITYSSIAREYLLREGLPPDRIVKVGSPMREVIEYYSNKIFSSDILAQLSLKECQYFLLSVHREENIDSQDNFISFLALLDFLAEHYSLPVIVSTHPRTRKRINSKNIELHHLVNLLNPLSYTDYMKLQLNAKAVLSDSGSISEESSILNFPALNLRECHERPEAMEEAAVMMVGMDKDRVLQGMQIMESQGRLDKRNLNIVYDYSQTNVSDKIVRIINSYVGYINDVVWKMNR